MSSLSHHSHRGSSSHSTTPDRPASIPELAAIAQKDVWDPDKPLKHWLRSAEKARKSGQTHVEAQNFEAAFIDFARAATIVLERLPTHSEYMTLLNADQRHNLGMNGQDMVEHLTQLKEILVDRYDRWNAKKESEREEVNRRRQDEQQRMQEERARQAREETQREEEWRRREMARREAEEMERRIKEESAWARQSSEAKSRESSEARRAAEAREAAEHERMAQAARLRRDDEGRRQQSDEEREQRTRRRLDERTRAEQEGILRRQQEADAAARAARREIAESTSSSTFRSTEPDYSRLVQQPGSNEGMNMPFPVVAPQPSRPASSSHHSAFVDPYPPVPAVMPLESPSKPDDDTDVERDGHRRSRRRQKEYDDAPTKAMKNLRISYPPPITTTSPAPRDLGPIRYPTLMSQHQLKQGYVPSLQSMFSPSSSDLPTSSSLLLEGRPSAGLYSNILPKRSTPSPVIPPYPPGGAPAPDHAAYPTYDAQQRYGTPYRGHSPPTTRPPLPLPPPHAPPLSVAPRITKVASKDANVRELKSVRLPRECLPRFLSIARINTERNRETCGLLLGKDRGNKYVVTTLLVPKQHSTSDTCTMDEEELVMQFTEERKLITLGWIHTHPTQSCFMSSVDLHTHSGFQQMLPESFAVVCAPSSTPTFGIFRLTDPSGLRTILDCNAKEAFHPHSDAPIYTDCDNNHVVMKDMSLEIVDLR